MKTSTGRILSTHVGSIPRPESIGALPRARPPWGTEGTRETAKKSHCSENPAAGFRLALRLRARG
jgi:hypothetical protein